MAQLNFRPLLVPLLSLVIFATGSNLLGTLLTVSMGARGVPMMLIGALTSFFYIGYALGAVHLEYTLIRVGFVRTYSALAALTASIALLQGLWDAPILWIFLRCLYGFCVVGMFMIIEMWFITLAEASVRARVLSIYTLFMYGAQIVGQWFLGVGDWAHTNQHFCLAAILLMLSVLPLSLSRQIAPNVAEQRALSLKTLWSIAPIGVIGSSIGGATLGLFYGFMPVFAQQRWGTLGISVVMSAIIFGGIILQCPLGRLSDVWGRGKTLALAALMGALAAFTMFWQLPLWLFLVVACCLGGCIFSLYPLSASYACDRVAASEVLKVTSGIRVAYSLGAISGPMLCAFLVARLGEIGLFASYFVLTAVLGLSAAYVERRRRIVV